MQSLQFRTLSQIGRTSLKRMRVHACLSLVLPGSSQRCECISRDGGREARKVSVKHEDSTQMPAVNYSAFTCGIARYWGLDRLQCPHFASMSTNQRDKGKTTSQLSTPYLQKFFHNRDHGAIVEREEDIHR